MFDESASSTTRRRLLASGGAALALAACGGGGRKTAAPAPSDDPIGHFRDHSPIDFGSLHPGRYAIHGVDVSRYQGAIDWRRVRASGVSFAFIKSTEGADHSDPMFHRNWRGAHAAGIAHAPYHFFHWCSTAQSQANWFIRNVPRAAVNLPPVLDVEWNAHSRSCRGRPAPANVRAAMRVWMDTVERAFGKKPIIYTAPDFYRDNLRGYFSDHHFWLRAVAEHPRRVYPGKNWTFWQYTGTGAVPGIRGKVDLNAFAGSTQVWERDWARG